jgi:hypothetical protein
LEFRCRRSLGLGENLNDSGSHLLVILDELAVLSKVQTLEEETQPRQDKKFIFVDTEREAQSSLAQKLNDLDDVLRRSSNCK